MTEINRDLVCVLIPTLNEKATIGPVIEELKAFGYNNILVADGRSTDGTPEMAEKLGAKVMTQQGKGKGKAKSGSTILSANSGGFVPSPSSIKI